MADEQKPVIDTDVIDPPNLNGHNNKLPSTNNVSGNVGNIEENKENKTQVNGIDSKETDVTKNGIEDDGSIYAESDILNMSEVKEEDEEIEASIYTNKYDGTTSQIPDFAVIFSFFDIFGRYLELPPVSLTDLEQSINSTKELGRKGISG